MRLKVLAVAVGIAASALFAAPAAQSAEILQPGARMSTSVGGCTMNFVYDGVGKNAGKVYMGTAAHCVSGVGQDVRDAAGVTFGKVAYVAPWKAVADDFAFIEVDSEDVGRVNAALRGHPQYPTGVSTDLETNTGDKVQLSGHGVPFYATQTTREQRVGVLTFDDSDVHRVYAPILWGDSGGPLVHAPSGKALGIVSQLCTGGTCTERGPTVEGLIRQAAAAGFEVALRTV